MNKVREQALIQAHGKERKLAEQALRARNLHKTASYHSKHARNGTALQFYLKMLIVMPGLLISSLTRPMILAPMTKSLTGSLGFGRRLVSWMEKMPKHDEVDRSVVKVVDADLLHQGTQRFNKNEYPSEFLSTDNANKADADE